VGEGGGQSTWACVWCTAGGLTDTSRGGEGRHCPNPNNPRAVGVSSPSPTKPPPAPVEFTTPPQTRRSRRCPRRSSGRRAACPASQVRLVRLVVGGCVGVLQGDGRQPSTRAPWTAPLTRACTATQPLLLLIQTHQNPDISLLLLLLLFLNPPRNNNRQERLPHRQHRGPSGGAARGRGAGRKELHLQVSQVPVRSVGGRAGRQAGTEEGRLPPVREDACACIAWVGDVHPPPAITPLAPLTL
jgi:hypothetical protein